MPDDPASWVIVNSVNGQSFFETFNPQTAKMAAVLGYKVLPISEYLETLNRAISEAGGVQPSDTAIKEAFGL